MHRFAVCCLLLLLVGCGKKDRTGSKDLEAIMKGQPTTYWIEQLTNPDEEKRTVAVKLLVENGKKNEYVVEDLADALETKDDPDLRIAVCAVLERIGLNANTKDVVSSLKKLLLVKDDRVANAGAKALWRLNKDEARIAGVAPPAPEKK
jgi:HEAT repeat protein